jgi:hypothetical protein
MDARVVVSPKPTAIGMVQGMKKLLFPNTIYLVIVKDIGVVFRLD